MLVMAAGNVPVKELLAKLMLCKSTGIAYMCNNVLLVLYADHELFRIQCMSQW